MLNLTQGKSTFVKIIISKNMKKSWKKFTEREEYPSVSQMIRNAVNDFIRNNNKNKKQKELEQIQEQLNRVEKERDELIHLHKELIEQMKELNKTNIDSKTEMRNRNIKYEIIALLGKGSSSSINLSKILNIPETEILICLNEMQEFGIMTFNADRIEYNLKQDYIETLLFMEKNKKK